MSEFKTCDQWVEHLDENTKTLIDGNTYELVKSTWGVATSAIKPETVTENERLQASVPEFLLEMSRQMREQPNRATAHPFWQVRCKRSLPTEQGYNESHYEVCGDEGPVYSSNTPLSGLSEYLLEHHESWCRAWASENHEDDADYTDAVSNWIDPESDLPAELTLVYAQEIEEVVTTHLTQAGAEAFIKRKQHDYPKLYTYVESACWSPQLRELQDWIIGLTPKQDGADDEGSEQ